MQLLIAAADSDDQAVGFHAQQAVAKCLKAALSKKNIAFRKTHDLVELLDLVRDHSGALPTNAEALEMLNPFAVTWRYDLFEAEPVDRDWIAATVQTVREWAQSEVESGVDVKGGGESTS